MPCPLKTARHDIFRKRKASINGEGLQEPFPFALDSSQSSKSLHSLSNHMKRLKCDDDQEASSSLESILSGHSITVSHSKYNCLDNQISTMTTADVERIFQGDENGNNQLHACISQCQAREAMDIINKAPNFDVINLENDKGQTALHLAVLKGQPKLVRRLICAGAMVDAVDERGRTPLHLACHGQSDEIVRHLLRPVDYQETLCNNYTIPFQMIPQNMEVEDNDGRTCLKIALLNNKLSFVEILTKSDEKVMCELISLLDDVISEDEDYESEEEDDNERTKSSILPYYASLNTYDKLRTFSSQCSMMQENSYFDDCSLLS